MLIVLLVVYWSQLIPMSYVSVIWRERKRFARCNRSFDLLVWCVIRSAPKAFPLRGRWHGVAVTDEVVCDPHRTPYQRDDVGIVPYV